MTDIALPTGSTDADRFARSLALLIGPSITAVDGSLVAEDLRVLGGMLARARSRVLLAVAQSHPSSASELLDELEEEYGLPRGASLSTADRQARLLAKVRSRNAGTLPALLITVQTLATEAELLTISWDLVAGTDPTAVHRFVMLVSSAHRTNTTLLATLDALLASQAPAHVSWTTGRGDGTGTIPRFRCARRTTVAENSLCDRDVLQL